MVVVLTFTSNLSTKDLMEHCMFEILVHNGSIGLTLTCYYTPVLNLELDK